MSVRVVVLLVAALAPAALAQQRREPSERERAYGDQLAERLGDEPLRAGKARAAKVQTVRVPVDPPPAREADPPLLDAPLPPDSPRPAPAAGRGIEVDLGDIKVTRLRFDSPEEAQRHLSWLGAHHPGEPVIGELRGDQVVTATGKDLTDPDLAYRVRLGLWDGLPAPPETDAAFVDLGDGRNVAVSSRLTSGPVRDRIDALTAAGRRGNPELVMESPTGPRIFGQGNSRSQTRIDEDGASFWSSQARKFGVMGRHFAGVGAHPRPPQPPRRGARGALQEAMGGK